MTRLTDRTTPPPREVDAVLDLLLGPPTDHTIEELRLAWAAFGAELVDAGVGRGWRCWGYWFFELGESPPEDRQQPRLAELGLLTGTELALLAEDADHARKRLAEGEPFYNGAEEGCREMVALHERVQESVALHRRVSAS